MEKQLKHFEKEFKKEEEKKTEAEKLIAAKKQDLDKILRELVPKDIKAIYDSLFKNTDKIEVSTVNCLISILKGVRNPSENDIEVFRKSIFYPFRFICANMKVWSSK
jgi:hypothetical protein